MGDLYEMAECCDALFCLNTKCQKRFDLGCDLLAHLKKEKHFFFCRHCGVECSSDEDLLHHNLIAHLNAEPFACTSCERTRFEDRSAFARHLRSEHGGPYECDECSDVFSSRSARRKHQAVHVIGQNPNAISEDLVRALHLAQSREWKIKDPSLSGGETQSELSNESFFAECVACLELFDSGADYATHLLLECLTCDVCFETHESQRAFLRHPCVQAGQVCFLCVECSFSTDNFDVYRDHVLQNHSGPYQCYYCEWKTAHRPEIRGHVMSAHQSCETVQTKEQLEALSSPKGKELLSKRANMPLNVNLSEENLPLASAEYAGQYAAHSTECFECDSSFSSPSEWITHIESHHLKCVVCAMRFEDKGKFSDHFWSKHDGKLLYWCDGCNDQIPSNYLYSHIMDVHWPSTTQGVQVSEMTKEKCKEKNLPSSLVRPSLEMQRRKNIESPLSLSYRSSSTLKSRPILAYDRSISAPFMPRANKTKNKDMLQRLIARESICTSSPTVQLNQHRVISPLDKSKDNSLFRCSKCNSRFTSAAVLAVHGQLDHDLFCVVCRARYGKLSLLQSHLTHDHSLFKFVCTVCSEEFLSSDVCKQHIKSCLAGDEVEDIEICEDEKTVNGKNEAKSKYASGTSLQDGLCKQECSSDFALPVASFTKSGKLYHLPCPVCHQRCRTVYEMSHHLTELHSQVCSMCLAVCSSARNLVNHVTYSHDGCKPYYCQLCQPVEMVAMSDVDEYRRHLRLQHDYPYICAECSCTCFTRSSYAMHYVQNHTSDWSDMVKHSVLQITEKPEELMELYLKWKRGNSKSLTKQRKTGVNMENCAVRTPPLVKVENQQRAANKDSGNTATKPANSEKDSVNTSTNTLLRDEEENMEVSTQGTIGGKDDKAENNSLAKLKDIVSTIAI